MDKWCGLGGGWQVPAALHWPDVRLPQALSVRVREAGWLWSGAIYLDSPGDQFCKIRHRCSCIHPPFPM